MTGEEESLRLLCSTVGIFEEQLVAAVGRQEVETNLSVNCYLLHWLFNIVC